MIAFYCPNFEEEALTSHESWRIKPRAQDSRAPGVQVSPFYPFRIRRLFNCGVKVEGGRKLGFTCIPSSADHNMSIYLPLGPSAPSPRSPIATRCRVPTQLVFRLGSSVPAYSTYRSMHRHGPDYIGFFDPIPRSTTGERFGHFMKWEDRSGNC
jgi:hypothetical protein